MNILVCVKQVLNTEEVKPNYDKGVLDTGVAASILNPYDGYALETAALLKDKDSSINIYVLTVGEEKSIGVIRDCLAVGADFGYIVATDSVSNEGGLSKGLVISKAIKKIEEKVGKFSLILCGKQSINGESGQIAAQVAEYLDYPQITGAIEVELEDELVKVKKEAESGYLLVGANAPVVISITQTFYEPRYATIKSKMAAKKATVESISLSSLEIDENNKANKSLARVISTTLPPKRKGGQIINEGSVADSSKKLVELLSAASII